jgi:hypothetical protein
VVDLEGGSPDGIRLSVDGEDVTDRCAIRVDRAHPPRRAEVVVRDLTAGEHRAELAWPGGRHEWRFEIA